MVTPALVRDSLLFKVTLSVFMLLLFFAGIMLIIAYDLNSREQSSGIVPVEIIGDNDYLLVEVELSHEISLYEALSEQLEIDYTHYYGLGRFIIRIDFLRQTENRYIIIYINGERATTGIDDIYYETDMTVSFVLE